MTQSIISEWEVIKYGDLSPDTQTCNIGSYHISLNRDLKKCLGKDFLDYITSKLASYTYTNYDLGGLYSLGEVVVFESVLYRCKVATTTDIAGHPQSWELAPKFTEPCLNVFWCNYLAPYCAWFVRNIKEPFWFFEKKAVNSDGIARSIAGDKVFASLMISIREQVKDAYLSMHEYLVENKEICGFSKYLGNQEDNSCGCGDSGNACLNEKIGSTNPWNIM